MSIYDTWVKKKNLYDLMNRGKLSTYGYGELLNMTTLPGLRIYIRQHAQYMGINLL